MSIALLWICLAVGAAGAVLGLTTGCFRKIRDRETRFEWIVAGGSLLGTVILFLLTLPVDPPVFSLGQHMGYGILIGGVLGTIAGIWATRTRGLSNWSTTVSIAGISSLALFGVSLILLIFQGYPQFALGGFIIGALLASVLFRLILAEASSIDVWMLSATALAATTLLAIQRYDTTVERVWWTAPILLFATAIVVTIATAFIPRNQKGYGLQALIASVIILGLTAIFAWKLYPQWPLLYVAIAGAVTFALITWLSPMTPGSSSYAAFVVIIATAFSALGFKLMAGFGIGIGLLASLGILLPFFALAQQEPAGERGKTENSVMLTAAFICVGIMFARLFMETYIRELRGLDLEAHYTFISLVIGAVLPFLVMSFAANPERRNRYLAVVSATALGIFAAAIPLVICAVWGFKAELGFILGTIAARFFILFTDIGVASARARQFAGTAVLVVIAQASAVLLSGLVTPLTEAKRSTRISILIGLLIVGLIWAGISALVARKESREA